jgi:hypothetical protein
VSGAIQIRVRRTMDCFVALLLAMTVEDPELKYMNRLASWNRSSSTLAGVRRLATELQSERLPTETAGAVNDDGGLFMSMGQTQ